MGPEQRFSGVCILALLETIVVGTGKPSRPSSALRLLQVSEMLGKQLLLLIGIIHINLFVRFHNLNRLLLGFPRLNLLV